MTALRSAVASATESLSLGAHPERARQDAETLLLHILRKNKAWMITHPAKELTDADANRYSDFTVRRQRGEPIQYILGETEFYRMQFVVTPDVLIPRPETEFLVEAANELIPIFDPRPGRIFGARVIRSFAHREDFPPRDGDLQTAGWPPRILDVGTGSGAIAISIAHDWSEAAITSVDISAAALAIARDNAERLGFASQIRFLKGDLLAPVAGERFELIVSNPPYVPETDRASLSVEVRDHEPSLALFAGADGLDVYRRLIPDAYAALVPDGWLLLEIGYGQSDVIATLLNDAGFVDVKFVPDLQGIPRVACARRPPAHSV